MSIVSLGSISVKAGLPIVSFRIREHAPPFPDFIAYNFCRFRGDNWYQLPLIVN